jgi:hypothetical protein
VGQEKENIVKIPLPLAESVIAYIKLRECDCASPISVSEAIVHLAMIGAEAWNKEVEEKINALEPTYSQMNEFGGGDDMPTRGGNG